MQTACQVVILLLLLGELLLLLKVSFHGREARCPPGFAGAVTALVLSALLFLCYWKAGAFSTLLPS